MVVGLCFNFGGHIDSVASDMGTFGCMHAHRSVEDVHPFTCVALICISPTPRVVQRLKKTPLMIAMEKKNDAMVTTLLDHNADPDIRDYVRQGAHEDERGGESMDMWAQ